MNEDLFRELSAKYIPFSSPNIREDLYSRYEFSEEATESSTLFRHQVVGARLIAQTDNAILLKHKVGSGKTRTVLTYTENELRVNPNVKIFVITSKALKTVIYDELNKISPHYRLGVKRGTEKMLSTKARLKLTEEEVEMKMMLTRETAISRSAEKNIKESYTIVTIDKFCTIFTELSKKPKKLSNIIIWIDEVQSLGVRVGKDGRPSVIEPEQKEEILYMLKEKDPVNKKRQYNILFDVLGTYKPKLIMTTDTPVIGDYSTFASIMNLLIKASPNCGLELVSGNSKFKDGSIFNGFFSSYGAPIAGIKIVEMGTEVSLEGNTIVLSLAVMSKEHSEHVRSFGKINVYINAILASLFYSKTLTKETSFDTQFTKKLEIECTQKKTLEEFKNSFSDFMSDWNETHPEKKILLRSNERTVMFNLIAKLEVVKTYSPVYYTILKGILLDGTSKDYQEAGIMKGNVYVHNPYVEGPALKALGALLQWFGFIQYSGTTSAFSEGRIFLAKEKRFCIVDGSIAEPHLKNMLALQKHKDNYDGDYLRIFIVSNVGSIGLSIFSVLQMYVAPMWNKTDEDQSVARSIRANSYDVIKSLLRNAGKPETVNVKLYRTASVYSTWNEGKNDLSPDLITHKIALQKEQKAKKIIDLIYVNSLDYYINYDSIELKTLKKEPKPILKEVQYSTYLANYVESHAHSYLKNVLKSLRMEDKISMRKFPSVVSRSINSHILRLLDNNLFSGVNRYGFESILKFSNGDFTFEGVNSINSNILLWVNPTLVVEESIPFVEPVNDESFEDTFKALTLKTNPSFIEDSWSNFIKGITLSPWDMFVTEKTKHLVFSVPVMSNETNIGRITRKNISLKKGKGVSGIFVDLNANREKVYISIVSSFLNKNLSYASFLNPDAVNVFENNMWNSPCFSNNADNIQCIYYLSAAKEHIRQLVSKMEIPFLVKIQDDWRVVNSPVDAKSQNKGILLANLTKIDVLRHIFASINNREAGEDKTITKSDFLSISKEYPGMAFTETELLSFLKTGDIRYSANKTVLVERLVTILKDKNRTLTIL